MVTERRDYLRARYRSLGWGEATAAAVFAGVGAWSIPDAFAADAVVAIWWAMTPLLVVLVQAAVYWLAARSWVEASVMPRGMARLYRAFAVLDAVLLLIAAAMIATHWPSVTADAVVVVLVWLFGVVEYTNYFVVRLAYRRRWWTHVRERRRPQLMLDVDEALQVP
jgi:hypothetical protein